MNEVRLPKSIIDYIVVLTLNETLGKILKLMLISERLICKTFTLAKKGEAYEK